jgi:hypothetical protein
MEKREILRIENIALNALLLGNTILGKYTTLNQYILQYMNAGYAIKVILEATDNPRVFVHLAEFQNLEEIKKLH